LDVCYLNWAIALINTIAFSPPLKLAPLYPNRFRFLNCNLAHPKARLKAHIPVVLVLGSRRKAFSTLFTPLNRWHLDSLFNF